MLVRVLTSACSVIIWLRSLKQDSAFSYKRMCISPFTNCSEFHWAARGQSANEAFNVASFELHSWADTYSKETSYLETITHRDKI